MKDSRVQIEELQGTIRETTNAKIVEWCSTISEDYMDRLKTHLLTRNPETRLLSLNFDPELLALLQEVKFLERNLGDQIPAVAVQIYQNNRVYSEYIHMLQVLINRYNHPLSTIVPTIHRHIDQVDEVLKPGVEELTWEEPAAGEWLQASVRDVTTFSELHNKSTSNIATIRAKIESWKTPALFSGTDVKKSLDAAEVNAVINARSTLITTQSAEIAELVRGSVSALTDSADAGSLETKQYLDYVMSIIVEGFKSNIMFSLKALLRDLSPGPTDARQIAAVPLITTRLELVGNAVLFSPAVMDTEGRRGGDLYTIFQDWCTRAVELTKLIDVVYEGQEPLHAKIAADAEISAAIAKICSCVESMAKQCIAFKKENFAKYSTVWTQSRESFIAEFLQSGGGLSEPDKITGLDWAEKARIGALWRRNWRLSEIAE
jgi:dynein heavy chain